MISNMKKIIVFLEVNMLSLKIKCNNHELVLLLPENDLEYVELVSQISELFLHIKDNPTCKFEELL